MMRLQQPACVIVFLLSLTSGPAVEAVPCQTNVCGVNTRCDDVRGRSACSCLPGHFGDPFLACNRGECLDNSDCPYNRACVNGVCENVCRGTCGQGANCNIHEHIAVCTCPEGYTGDPTTYCRPMDPQELCNPSPCGANTKCNVNPLTNVPVCSCLPGYQGSALTGCVRECESDAQCHLDQSCQDFHCRPVCSQDTCGKDARCHAQDHRAICHCPEGYVGNPYSSCRPECYLDNECPTNKPACWNNKCVDPCSGACGHNADCKVRAGVAVCSCPKGSTGNPLEYCRPLSKDDLCKPSPCGVNAICQPGEDNITGNYRAICTCSPGYSGNALYFCQRG